MLGKARKSPPQICKDHFVAIHLPISEATKSLMMKLLDIPQVETSRYWENRRKDLSYDFDSSSVRMSGMYDSPKEKFAKRRLSRRFTMLFGVKHKSYAFLTKHEFKIPIQLIQYFHKYDLAKSMYLYENIMKHEKLIPRPFVITEIGAGAGILGVLALADRRVEKYIDIDLKEMLPHAVATHALFTQLSDISINNTKAEGVVNFFDTSNLPEISFSVGVNAVSFQEMDPKQIVGYMKYLERNLKVGGLFFSLQRVEKKDESRCLDFIESEIPWPSSLKTIRYEESIISRYNGDSLRIVLRVLQKETGVL
jgi:hypothetical protein